MYAPQPLERRKLLPDPENEPDFYEISQLFPLPDDQTNHLDEARAALSRRGIYLTNDVSTPSFPPYAVPTTSDLMHGSARVTGSSPFFPINDLSLSTLNAVAAARLSIADRMPGMDSSGNGLMSTNLPLRYGLSTVDQQPTLGSNSFALALRNNPWQSINFNALSQYYQNDTTYERLRSTLGLSQLLAAQESHDRVASYLQFLNSQGCDDIDSKPEEKNIE